MSSYFGEGVLNFFQALMTSYDRIELEGVRYCQEKRPFANGSYGKVYRVYPLDGNGRPDKKIPLALKYHELRKTPEKTFEAAVSEAKKHQLVFDNKVYQLKDGQVVTLMPLFPGKPILRYDETLNQDILHEKLKALTLSQRLELCALVIQTYAEFYADRLNRDSLQHTDLKPENILIEIKIDKKGRAFFQCNILDFGDDARTVVTQAPEDSGVGSEHDSQMAVYSLTSVIAVILGETDPYRYKDASLSHKMAISAPFYFENMQKFLCKAMKSYQDVALDNIVDATVDLAKSMAIVDEDTSSEILLKRMTAQELIIEIIVAMVNQNGGYNLAFLSENLQALTQQALIVELILNVVNRMSAREPKDRPELLAIARIFNTLALELRRCEYNIQINPQGSERSENDKMVSKEPIIPIRNHLLTHSFATFFPQEVAQSSYSDSGKEKEAGKEALIESEQSSFDAPSTYQVM